MGGGGAEGGPELRPAHWVGWCAVEVDMGEGWPWSLWVWRRGRHGRRGKGGHLLTTLQCCLVSLTAADCSLTRLATFPQPGFQRHHNALHPLFCQILHQ